MALGFYGGIDSYMRRWLYTNRSLFEGKTLFCGCSGNFTVEQILSPFAASTHSNDVSVYSHVVGNWLARQECRLSVTEPEYQWLEPYLETNQAAAVVVLFDLLKFRPDGNRYSMAMYRHMRDHWQDRFEKTAEKLEAVRGKCQIDSYRSSDIVEFLNWARGKDPDGVFVAYLPFGPNDFESQFRKINKILDWDRPAFKMLEQETIDGLFSQISESGPFVALHNKPQDAQPLVALREARRSSNVYLYSNLAEAEKVYVFPHMKEEPGNFELVTEEDLDATGKQTKIQIARINGSVANHYKNRFMKKTIQYTDGMWNFVFALNGKAFAFVVITMDTLGRQHGGGVVDPLYVLSDFVVPVSTRYRLAKLALLTMQTRTFRAMLEELVFRRVGWLVTTAFTKHQVSTKYRGVWNLVKRGEVNVPEKLLHGDIYLNYATETGILTEKQALAKWRDRFLKN